MPRVANAIPAWAQLYLATAARRDNAQQWALISQRQESESQKIKMEQQERIRQLRVQAQSQQNAGKMQQSLEKEKRANTFNADLRGY